MSNDDSKPLDYATPKPPPKQSWMTPILVALVTMIVLLVTFVWFTVAATGR